MAAPLFELVTELQTLTRRDFPAADETSLNPLSVRPLVEGEWLELDSNYKLARGGDNNAGTPDEGLSMNSFVVHTERGRYDVQAIRKVNVLMLGMYEADTQIVDTAGLALGDALTVQDISIGGVVRRGLKKAGATAGRVVVGYVSKLYASGPAKVRFVHMANAKYL
jgi:hypothetical protein